MKDVNASKTKRTLSISADGWSALSGLALEVDRPISWVVDKLALSAWSRVGSRKRLAAEPGAKVDVIARYNEELEDCGLR